MPQVHRQGLLTRRLLDDPAVEVVDIAVPPDVRPGVIEEVLARRGRIRGILAQKPLATNYAEAKRVVERCRGAGVKLVVNQNMRYDHAVRGCGNLLQQGVLGDPVLATIEMRAVPHWMPWQERPGWVTLRIMAIHHLDTFCHWFGRDLDLPIVSLCCVALGRVDFNPSVRRFHLDRCRAFVDLAAELGCSNLLLVLGEYIWQQEVIPPAEQWRAGVDAASPTRQIPYRIAWATAASSATIRGRLVNEFWPRPAGIRRPCRGN